MAARTSSISSSKAARALAIAAALVVAANVWVGVRLPALIPESSLDNLLDLERRIAAYPHKERVKLLVFGNSHAIAGLRPPVLAKSLGLAADEVFSLALPSGSPLEMRLLAERYAPAFPAARTALFGVEEFFVGEAIDIRLRYLTRHSLAERWTHARRYPKLEERVALMAGWFLPALDYGTALRSVLATHPALFAQRLLQDRLREDTLRHRLLSVNHPWGYPPVWEEKDVAAQLAKKAFTGTEQQQLINRAYQLTRGEPFYASGFDELEHVSRFLERRGVRILLTEMPYYPPLRETLEHEQPGYKTYKVLLAGYLTTSHRRLLPAPEGWPRTCFNDLDHMSKVGAARMADWLKQKQVLATPAPGHGGST